MLVAIACVFAVVNGANDGAAMVASSLKAPGLRPLGGIAVLAAALVGVPMLLGTSVASTIAQGLVSAPEDALARLLGLGVTAAMLVAFLLSRRGLPTSLTLAVVGGIVGVGMGSNFDVSWGTVGVVLAVGAAAPVVGAVLGAWTSRASPLLGGPAGSHRLARAHAAAFLLQSIAYAANDGQKMFAVFAVVGASGAAELPFWQPVVVAVLFSAGVVVGVRPAAGTLGTGVLRSGPSEQVTTEFSAALAVLGSAALAAPVSMTQSLSGALIGAGVRRGYRQIRWRAAARLAAAWVITLPCSAAVGAVVALAGGLA